MYNADLLKAIGATHIVDRKSDAIAEVKKITSEPIDFVLDSISEGGTQEQAWEILAPGGTLVLTLRPTVDKEKYNDKHLLHLFAAFHYDKPLGITFAKFLPKLFEEGLIKVSLKINDSSIIVHISYPNLYNHYSRTMSRFFQGAFRELKPG